MPETITLDANQRCPACGRDFGGETDADAQPGQACPAEECPSHCLADDDGEAGLICLNVWTGEHLRLRERSDWKPNFWKVDRWWMGKWLPYGFIVPADNLRPVASPDMALPAPTA